MNRRIRTHLEALQRRYVLDAYLDAALAAGIPPPSEVPADTFRAVPMDEPVLRDGRWFPEGPSNQRVVLGRSIEGVVAKFYGSAPRDARVYVEFPDPANRLASEKVPSRFTQGYVVPTSNSTWGVAVDRVDFAASVTSVDVRVLFLCDADLSYAVPAPTVRFVDQRLTFDTRWDVPNGPVEIAGSSRWYAAPSIVDATPPVDRLASRTMSVRVDWGDGTPAYVEQRAFTPTDLSIPMRLAVHAYENPGTYVQTITIDLPQPDYPGPMVWTRELDVSPKPTPPTVPPANYPAPSVVPDYLKVDVRYQDMVRVERGQSVRSLGVTFQASREAPLQAVAEWEDGTVNAVRLVMQTRKDGEIYYDAELETPRAFPDRFSAGLLKVYGPDSEEPVCIARTLIAVDDGSIAFVPDTGIYAWYRRIERGHRRTLCLASFVDFDAPADARYEAEVVAEDGTKVAANVVQPYGSAERYVTADLLTWKGYCDTETVSVTVRRSDGANAERLVHVVVDGGGWVQPTYTEALLRDWLQVIACRNPYKFRGGSVTTLPSVVHWTGPEEELARRAISVNWDDGVVTPGEFRRRADGAFDLITDRSFDRPTRIGFAARQETGSREPIVIGGGFVIVGAGVSNDLVIGDRVNHTTASTRFDYGSYGIWLVIGTLVDIGDGAGRWIPSSVTFDDGSVGRVSVTQFDSSDLFTVAIQPYLLTDGLHSYHVTVGRGDDVILLAGTVESRSRTEEVGNAPSVDELMPYEGPSWIDKRSSTSLLPLVEDGSDVAEQHSNDLPDSHPAERKVPAPAPGKTSIVLLPRSAWAADELFAPADEDASASAIVLN
jgi:hypothetical protein